MEIIDFKTKLWIGDDALEQLKSLKDRRVFIVTDPFLKENGTDDKIIAYLDQCETTLFTDIIPDPPIDKIVSGIQKMAEFKADTIVAVGGGSAIDAAKAMKFFGQRTVDVKIDQFLAVPTTSGTGSEVTNFSVLTIPSTGTKIPLVTDEIQPDIAILDTDLVLTVPAKITADTGLDVLTHAIESYVSANHSEVADVLSEKVVQLVFTYLKRAYQDGNDKEARAKMHLASCLAGMAFNLTSLGINHGIAHAAGARLHVPHGRINAILLPDVIAFNASLEDYDAADHDTAKKYMKLANLIADGKTVNPRIGTKNLIREIKQLRKKLNEPATLSEYGLSKETLAENKAAICKGALQDRCTVTNPKKVTIDDVSAIYDSIS